MLLGAKAAKNLPHELLAFVPADKRVIDFTQADLNGDGKKDAILVVQDKESVVESESDAESDSLNKDNEGLRTLLLLQRQNDGKLKLVVSNDNAVMCEKCGGVFGDPFEGIRAEKKGFVIYHYGGASWRWRNDFTFGWSPRDQTWQLVKVSTLEYHASDPENIETEDFVSPRDFGLINLAEFDMDDWQGKGKR